MSESGGSICQLPVAGINHDLGVLQDSGNLAQHRDRLDIPLAVFFYSLSLGTTPFHFDPNIGIEYAQQPLSAVDIGQCRTI